MRNFFQNCVNIKFAEIKTAKIEPTQHLHGGGH